MVMNAFDTNFDGENEFYACNTIAHCYAKRPIRIERNRPVRIYLANMTEFDPIKVDRISPEDARSIRDGGAQATLRGIEFYNFGAFFSRAYRENDYLWGRLHGAERLIDITASTLGTEGPVPPDEIDALKRDAFLAILSEERAAELCASSLIDRLEREVRERLG